MKINQESKKTPEIQSLTQASHESQSDQHNNATEAPVPDSGSASISSNDNRKVSREDIELVQNLIERCLQLYMNRDEVVKTLLNRARIDPGFTTLEIGRRECGFFQSLLHKTETEEADHSVQSSTRTSIPSYKVSGASEASSCSYSKWHPSHASAVNNLPMGYPVLPQPSMATPGSQRPAYPSSKPTKDWDKLEAQVKREEKDEKLDGHAALNKFFRDIYKDADDDTKRAMRKSFVSQLYFCTLYEHITYHWATPSTSCCKDSRFYRSRVGI